jgi:hypothetical protein
MYMTASSPATVREMKLGTLAGEGEAAKGEASGKALLACFREESEAEQARRSLYLLPSRKPFASRVWWIWEEIRSERAPSRAGESFFWTHSSSESSGVTLRYVREKGMGVSCADVVVERKV